MPQRRYNKDECPKCLEPLSSPTISKRMLGEVSTHKQPPISAMESYSGVCSRVADPNGGPHHWKFGKCVQCGKGEGEEAKERQLSQGGTAWARSGVTWAEEANITVAATRRACPTCGFAWRDVYGKPECPKCFGSLRALVPRRRVGEVSTHKQPPMSAMESSSGECLLAPLPGTAYLGPHRWKWGKCARCGKGEGDEAKLRQIKIEAAQEQVRQHVRKSRERLGLDNINELGPRMMGEARRGDSKLVACWGRPVKSCPTCFFAWFDVYGKNECPKCLQDLEGEYAPKPPGARASRARSPGRYSVSEALLASLSEKAAPVFGV